MHAYLDVQMPLTACFVNCSAVWCTPSKPVATRAQVANQQGRYLAKVFNMHRVGQQPDPASRNGLPAVVPAFQYRHLGSFAYVGADQAVLELAMQGGCSGLL
jgi:NADH dehydrogenase FAD-containing subunit